MKRIQWIIGSIFMLATYCLHAQNQNTQSTQKQSPAQTQSQAQTRQTQPTSSTPESQAGPDEARVDPKGTADTPGAAEAAAEANNNDNDGADSTQVSNEPAVPQTTSSQSGSPAVLAGERGRERDGTNTVQRASMNMAGSPARNLNLGEKQTVDVDSELRDRQDYSQEKQISAQNHNENNSGGANAGESNQINNNTRRENQAISDQNLSAKDKSASEQGQASDKGNDKPKRKQERKKN